MTGSTSTSHQTAKYQHLYHRANSRLDFLCGSLFKLTSLVLVVILFVISVKIVINVARDERIDELFEFTSQIRLNSGEYQKYDKCKYLKYGDIDGDHEHFMHQLCDLTITVKTTHSNHFFKLKAILDTWFKVAPSKIYFITDHADKSSVNLTRNHLIATECDNSHIREALVCKTQIEFETFYKNPAKWYCHVDDDNYVNIARLYQVLAEYDPSQMWYIGKKSTPTAISSSYKNKNYVFRFGTGGAGFCISYPLVMRMRPYIKELNQMENILKLPDDCAIGFIIEGLLGVNLTESQYFHSHLEYLGFLKQDLLQDQVTFSYSLHNNNLVGVAPSHSTQDLTRFLTIHCHLYPKDSICL